MVGKSALMEFATVKFCGFAGSWLTLSFLNTSMPSDVCFCSARSTARRSVKLAGDGLHLTKTVRSQSGTGRMLDNADRDMVISTRPVR